MEENQHLKFNRKPTTAFFLVGVILIITLFSVNLISATECYQEFANVSTACGGLDTGLYANVGAWNVANTFANTIDGSWTTTGPGQGNLIGTLYVNYTVPTGALSTSLWEVYTNPPGAVINYTINTTCWNPTTLQFRITSDNNAPFTINASCYNTTNWVTTYYGEAQILIYEEAMVWNISEVNINSYLIAPLNNSIFSESDINFTTTYNITGVNAQNYTWKNTTYNVWYENGTLFNQTFRVLSGNNTKNRTLISNFTTNDYKWNVLAYYGNDTYTNSTWSENNFTLSWRPFTIVNQSFNNHVYETDNQIFNLSITTLASVLSIQSKLFYNGTNYTATTSCSGGSCEINSSIDIPLVTSGDSQNKSFYWYITVYDGSSSFLFDTSTSILEQNVSRIYLEECNVTYTATAVNFTAYIEGNLTRIDPFKIAGTFTSWLGLGSVYRNVSVDRVSTSNLSLCIYPNKTFHTDAQLQYSFNDENHTYVPRNYYFDDTLLTNVSKEINLYLLESTDSTTFIIKVQDQKLSAIEGALVYIQRYYPSDGTFKTVQVAKTDSNGETVGFYETETVDYKHLIIKDGILLLETVQQKVVGKSVPYTLTFTTGGGLGYPWTPFEANPNIQSSLTFNKTNDIVTFSYIDISGATTSGRLVVLKESMSNSSSTVICNTSVVLASATITCNMTGYGGTFIAYGYADTEIINLLQFTITTAREIFGREGLLIGLFIIMVSGFAFIWNPSAGIIAINAAIIFTNLMGFISVSPVFIFGGIAISIIAIILLKT